MGCLHKKGALKVLCFCSTLVLVKLKVNAAGIRNVGEGISRVDLLEDVGDLSVVG